MPLTNAFEKEYRVKAGLVFTLVLVLLCVRFASNALLSQIGTNPILFEQSELLYRLFLKTGLLQLLISSNVALGLFDLVLFFLPVTFLITMNRGFAIMFSLLSLVYFLSFNVITGHHYHGLAGLLVITLPFWSKKEPRFNLLWEGARYYLLYIFASAALWKICRGSVFEAEQLSNILKAQQLDLLLQQPDSLKAIMAKYLISHVAVSHLVLVLNVALQFTFLIGFFTKRFDTVLLILCFVFVVGNYFVMSIVSSELLILCATLLSASQLEKIQRLFPTGEETATT